MQIIEVKNVNFGYAGQAVVQNINLDISQGDFVGLIGPNGSGKTTLIKICLGLIKPDSGQVKLFGVEISKFKDWKKIGYVSQRAGSEILHFPVTVDEVIGMEGVDTKTCEWALEMVEMGGFGKSLVMELSGGQQQRVFIARALAKKPELLVLDEPTTGIDRESQIRFYELLRKLNKQHQITLVLISHDIDVVAHEVTHLICINKTIICHGKPREILKTEFMEEIYGKNLSMIVHNH